jgi:radical SAM protein with 4Fe4S-binding SPASM domain
MGLVLRRESFGGIVGDSDAYGFHVINRAAYALLRGTAVQGEDPGHVEFFKDVRGRKWCDEHRVFQGRVIDNGNVVPFMSAPIRVWLEVTSRCSLECEQCINQTHPDHLGADLPLEVVCKILDDLAESGVLQITVTGGEPLGRRDIYQILDRIVAHRFGLRFFTNGVAVTEERARRLSEYPISHLFLSLDGVGEVNDQLRGSDTFRRIARGLKILAAKLDTVTLSTTLHRFSETGLDGFFALAAEYGVKSVLIRPLFEYRVGSVERSIPADHIEDLLSTLEAASAKHGVEYQLNKLPFRPLTKTIYHFDHPADVHFSYFNQHNSFGCVGGNTVVGIKANGVIIACGFVPHLYPAAGNSVCERRFLDLWNTSENVTYLRDLPGNLVCNNCSLLSVCGGGCRANALLRTGDINAVDPYCYWTARGIPLVEMPSEARNYADAPFPYISARKIITKCGSGSNL